MNETFCGIVPRYRAEDGREYYVAFVAPGIAASLQAVQAEHEARVGAAGKNWRRIKREGRRAFKRSLAAFRVTHRS